MSAPRMFAALKKGDDEPLHLSKSDLLQAARERQEEFVASAAGANINSRFVRLPIPPPPHLAHRYARERAANKKAEELEEVKLWESTWEPALGERKWARECALGSES